MSGAEPGRDLSATETRMEIGLALAREGRREGHEDRVGVAEPVIVRGRGERPDDQRFEHFGRNVLDVALPALSRRRARRRRRRAARSTGVGEGPCERDADVAGADEATSRFNGSGS